MNARSVSLASLLILMLLGWAGHGAAQAGADPAPQSANAATMPLRAGDVLEIRVWPSIDAQLSGEFVIEETGYVHLPLLGAVPAAGVAVDALRAELRSRYAQSVQNPVVTITPMYRVSVTGSVQRPGIHVITPTHTLFDVIGLAGGFSSSADAENVRVVRPGQVIDFNALRALETGEDMDVIQLRSGDHIVVPAIQPRRITARNAFEVVRTVSTLILIWDRFFRD